MNDIDVSVVLNMHREAPYLKATLRSLDASAEEAKRKGLRCELVAVFDRSDPETRQVFETTPMPGFDCQVVVDIAAGSLGLARNAGADASHGKYIWTADADDLVSRNAIVHLHSTASSAEGTSHAVFMNYLVGFGRKHLVGKYQDSGLLTVADYVWHHPYISRIFLRREVFQKHRFRDLRLTTGFAYEDWDFLVRLRQDGFHFLVAPDTVFFYRQRSDSLLRQADAVSAQMIPHSAFFEPAWFLQEFSRERRSIADWAAFVQKRRQTNLIDYAAEIFAQDALKDAVMDAHRIDPEVDPLKIASSPSYSPVPWHDDHIGFRLAEAFRMVGHCKFDDVALIPSLNPGKTQDLILRSLHAVADGAAPSQMLVICCEPAAEHSWLDRLPGQAVLLDAYNAFPSLSKEDRGRLIIRLLLAVGGPRARLHIDSSGSAEGLLDGYASILFERFSVFFHRADSEVIEWDAQQVECPKPLNLMRRYATKFSGIVYESEQTAQADRDRTGLSARHWLVSRAPAHGEPDDRYVEIAMRLQEMLLSANETRAYEEQP